MIEIALRNHLISQASLCPFLTTYAGELAVFNQEAPADTDDQWGEGLQYGRIVFAVDIQGDPERTMGGTLAVDILCEEDEQIPEEIEPIVRNLIHGYFFSNCKFVVSAQWKNSSYFTEPPRNVTGCTITFDLLGFPVLTTSIPDVIARINEWTYNTFEGLHVINYDELPCPAWKPSGPDAAVYWRLVSEAPASWIPDTFQTIWRTATIKCHIFAENLTVTSTVARDIVTRLYTDKRLLKDGETPIMVNRKNSEDYGADPLRTGQVTVEATFAIIVYRNNTATLQNIDIKERST